MSPRRGCCGRKLLQAQLNRVACQEKLTYILHTELHARGGLLLQGQLADGANFLDKAGAVAKKVTGALRSMAPSSNGSGASDSDGEDLVESVSDHLEGAGETVQKVRAVCLGLASKPGQSRPRVGRQICVV